MSREEKKWLYQAYLWAEGLSDSNSSRVIQTSLREGSAQLRRGGGAEEFFDHRPYSPGDDIRHFDWKLLARTDRSLTRTYHKTAAQKTLLVLDRSASMNVVSQKALLGKFDYGRALTAAVCLQRLRHHIATGILLSDTNHTDISALHDRYQISKITKSLEALVPNDRVSFLDRLKDIERHLPPATEVVIVSDFYEEPEQWKPVLLKIVARQSHVVCMQILDRSETRLPTVRKLRDQETGVKVRNLSRKQAVDYAAHFGVWLDQLRRSMQQCGVDYSLCWTDQLPTAMMTSRKSLVRI